LWRAISDVDIDQTRPLWHITLLDGATDGGAALVARMSHALTDGLTGMQLLAGLVDVGGKPVLAIPTDDLAAAEGETSVALTSGRLTAERVLTAPARVQARYWRN
jgi:hypothetical protein